MTGLRRWKAPIVGGYILLMLVSLGMGTGVAYALPPSQTEPAATPSPADLGLAAELTRNGEVDAAIGAYLAVIDRGTAGERLAARPALARVYLADGRYAAAVRQLDAYLLEAPAGADVRGAQLSLAEALASQGEWAETLPLYDAYIDAGGVAATYARMDRATALLRLGRLGEALRDARALRGEDLPSSVELPFILRVAQALEGVRPEEALVWYERLGRESSSPADQALAVWHDALIRQDLGDAGALPGAWVTIIQRFPATATAQEIVDDRPSQAIELDRYYTGLVHYRAGREVEAREEFEASLAANRTRQPSLAARASYYLALLDEDAGDASGALAGYSRVLELDSTVELADDALWRYGELLEELGRTSEAIEAYRMLAADFPATDVADGARFRPGLLAYDARRFAEAADEFGSAADAGDGTGRQRALLWQGKALAAAGDREEAESTWRTLREEAPDRYYGLRAAVLLGEADGSLEDAGLDEEVDPDWAAMRTWLRDLVGVEPSEALEALLYDEHWVLGQELASIGMPRRASAEFDLVLEGAGSDPAALYQAARFFHMAGATDHSSRAATRLLNAVPDEAAEGAPSGLWRLAYPVPFVEVLREASDAEGTPDILLLAMVRQESFFDPLAGSPAGALGLTQVIAPTGEAIAESLEMDGFEVEHLFRPSVSLRFGAHYLREQLDLFDGNAYQALAAYNAGPGNALRWREASGGDNDRFVEAISFSETKLYVRLVSENLARYRQLYGGLDVAALAAD